MLLKKIAMMCLVGGALVLAQDKVAPAQPAVRKTAPAAAALSPVDNVIKLLKGGMSEDLIIKTLRGQNKPYSPSMAELLKLQNAKVSDNIIGVLMDPGSGNAAIAAGPGPVPVPGPAPAPPVSAPAPVVAVSAECPAPGPVSAAPGALKRRLAVDAFDYSAVRSNVTAMFNNDLNIGQGIRAMLTAKMAQSKNITLLEREKLAEMMKEQDFGATNRVKRGTQAKIGGITGADAMLLGDIVIFGRDDVTSKKGAAAGTFARTLGGPVIGALATSKRTDKAVVAINLRLVDSETLEVLDSAEARGESIRKSTDWGAIAGSFRGAAAASSGMTSSNFQETIIGEATADAVTKIVAFLDQRIPKLPAKARTIEGRVATIDGCTLYLSVGGNLGVQAGDRFEIAQIIKEIPDPETHEVIDIQVQKVGEFVASTVRDKMAVGTYGGRPLSSDILAKPGYTARLVPQ